MIFHVDDRVYIHDKDNRARIYKNRHGLLWVAHEELLACGYRAINDFDVIYLNGTFYELQAHSLAANAWWIEPLQAQEFPEAEPASV